MHSASEHIAQFLICRACRTVAELKSSRVAQTIQQNAEHAGFAVAQQVVEVTGTCRDCGV
jgi:Fur family zinc uptake transcriptional regulator